MYRLILASESPRRKELLNRIGIPFQVFPVNISEIPDKTLNPAHQILEIAGRKARAAVNLLKEQGDIGPFILLAADTEVIFNGSLLGKPSSEGEAIQTLKRLSGQTHEVITAVQVIDSLSGNCHSHIETTKILFKTLSEDEICNYVATQEPMDKAGSYGIQGHAGQWVERIDGDFDNVVGLPVKAVAALIQSQGWRFTDELR